MDFKNGGIIQLHKLPPQDVLKPYLLYVWTWNKLYTGLNKGLLMRMNNDTGDKKCGMNNSLAKSLIHMRLWAWRMFSLGDIPTLTASSEEMVITICDQHCHSALEGHFCDTPQKPERQLQTLITQALLIHSISASWDMLTILLRASRGISVCSRIIFKHISQSVLLQEFSVFM